MAPSIYVFLQVWSERARFGTLIGDQALSSVLFPYVPLGAIALVTWTWVRQTAQEEVELVAVSEAEGA